MCSLTKTSFLIFITFQQFVVLFRRRVFTSYVSHHDEDDDHNHKLKSSLLWCVESKKLSKFETFKISPLTCRLIPYAEFWKGRNKIITSCCAVDHIFCAIFFFVFPLNFFNFIQPLRGRRQCQNSAPHCEKLSH